MRARVIFVILTVVTLAATPVMADTATNFGFRESVEDISLSPDGTRVAFIQPTAGAGSILIISEIESKAFKQILTSDGSPFRLSWCDWASNTRLVCKLYALKDDVGVLTPFTRLLAINIDGSSVKQLGQLRSTRALKIRQFDGDIIGWNNADNGKVLMSRFYVPEHAGGRLASDDEGLGVDQIDTLTLETSKIEVARAKIVNYLADEAGVVRLMSTESRLGDGTLRGVTNHYYRLAGDRTWKPFSGLDETKPELNPAVVDSAQNVVFAFGQHEGRQAIFKVSLDGSLSSELVLSHPKVDVDKLLTLGRTGRVIGAELVTDKRETIIFDAGYKALLSRLGKALPGLPIIRFAGASRDENRLLLFAGSDTDPGRYYVFDKKLKSLAEIALVRPQLEGVALSAVKSITYPASDGTSIPGYLTLPVGGSGKGLPTLVMPHGGPSSRDEWGFDWMAQYFAAQGFAVLQPNFRGSAGFGEDWYVDNGFKSWRTAIGDVNDAGRWLISQGIADPEKLAIIGWSYGGYAALQSAILDPALYKAVVAIAPVTDLKMLIDQSQDYTNSRLVADFVGTGEHIRSGSPLHRAGQLKAPVLMFSGDVDINVNITHARAMDTELRKLGKVSELGVYKGLDHQLGDSSARADMLRRANAFLREKLGVK